MEDKIRAHLAYYRSDVEHIQESIDAYAAMIEEGTSQEDERSIEETIIRLYQDLEVLRIQIRTLEALFR